MAKKNETRMIVIAPTSSVTPDQVTRVIHGLGVEISVKETCYGAMIEGDSESVHKVLAAVRKLDPDRIFSKVRGFPIGDIRRCRAHHGSRPGFTQLEEEWQCLSLVEKGVSAAARGEIHEEPPPKRKLTVKELEEIVEESR